MRDFNMRTLFTSRSPMFGLAGRSVFMAIGILCFFLPALAMGALATGPNHSVWVGTEKGLARLDENGHWETYTTESTYGGLPDDSVLSIQSGLDDSLWVGTGFGVVQLDKHGDWHAYTVPLRDTAAWNLAVGSDGSLWVANSSGLARLDTTGHWNTYTAASTKGKLPDDSVSGLASGPNGDTWIGNLRGVTRRDKNGQWITYARAKSRAEEYLPANSARYLTIGPGGSLWALFDTTLDGKSPPHEGMLATDLASIDESGRFQNHGTFWNAFGLAAAPDGSIWMGIVTEQGGELIRIDKDGQSNRYADPTVGRAVARGPVELAVGSDGSIWLNTDDSVIQRDDNGQWHEYPSVRKIFETQERSGASSSTMRFRFVNTGGNCHTCHWIDASGEITRETPHDFMNFVRHAEAQGIGTEHSLIALNSPGGDVVAGIQLGEAVRAQRLSTVVASSLEEGIGDGLKTFELRPGVCQSACFFAFIGGVRRLFELKVDGVQVSGSSLGVHRFATRESTSSVEAAQQLSATLADYASRMGIDPGILALAASVPEEQMHNLTRSEALKYLVVNMGLQPPTWKLERTAGDALVASLTGQVEYNGSDEFPNSWSFRLTVACRYVAPNKILQLNVKIENDEQYSEKDAFHYGLSRTDHLSSWKDDDIYWETGNWIGLGYRKSRRTDFERKSFKILNGNTELVFLLGPRSIRLVDSEPTLWLAIEPTGSAWRGKAPDRIPLPWTTRKDISRLLLKNCSE